MVKEIVRIVTPAPGETVENRRDGVCKLLVRMLAASPRTRASLIAYHRGAEEVWLPKWCLNLIVRLNVLDWVLQNPDGEAIAENPSAIDSVLEMRLVTRIAGELTHRDLTPMREGCEWTFKA